MARALITGAGIRVGRAIALALADAGYDLIVHANRSADSAEQLAAEVRARSRDAVVVQADLSQPDGVTALARCVAKIRAPLDVLVHNAGLYRAVPFADISRAAYRTMQAINLEAPFFLTQALLPKLRAAPAGALVVHITDIAAERAEVPYTHYMVSKAGLLALTRSLAVELAPEIRVNAVAPGTVAFPSDFPDSQAQAIRARIPLGRVGAPEDIARAVVFLARDGGYITGQVINVDGGRSAWL